MKYGGKLQRRPAGKFAPCRYPNLGCPKGTPEKPLALNERNAAAVMFWRRCRATGRFPDDPIVAWVAGLIQSVLDSEEQEYRDSIRTLVTFLAGGGNGRR